MNKTTKYFIALSVFTCSAVLLIQSCTTKNEKNNQAAQGFTFADKLSDYGFFGKDLKEMVPQQGVIPYNIVTPLFTDYAVKDRFIKLPAGGKIAYTAKGPLDFPDSTFIIKSFSYINKDGKKVLIETRLLFKEPNNGNWDVMDYLWNDAQTEATKFITGEKLPITLLDDLGNKISTNYEVPNVNDCKRCHISNNNLIPIGPKARNLNYTVPGDNQNQLVKWASMGILTGMPPLDSIQRLPDWKDGKKYTVNERARAYLDVNCSYCHTTGGDAYNTGLFLEFDQKNPDHLGILKLPVSAGGGAGGLNYDIIPGNPDSSILLHRLNSTEPGTAMPELTRTVIHKEGVALIREWIKEMPAVKR